MWKSLALAAGFVLAGSVLGPAASAQQPQCNERDNVLELLAKKYKETPIAAGVTTTGGLVDHHRHLAEGRELPRRGRRGLAHHGADGARPGGLNRRSLAAA
jgi:hypothetical protein